MCLFFADDMTCSPPPMPSPEMVKIATALEVLLCWTSPLMGAPFGTERESLGQKQLHFRPPTQSLLYPSELLNNTVDLILCMTTLVLNYRFDSDFTRTPSRSKPCFCIIGLSKMFSTVLRFGG